MKDKYAFWLTPETKTEAARLYTKVNCASQSEFAKKALRQCAAGQSAARRGENPRRAFVIRYGCN